MLDKLTHSSASALNVLFSFPARPNKVRQPIIVKNLHELFPTWRAPFDALAYAIVARC